MQEQVLHAHSEVEKQTYRCIVCGKSYEHVNEETTVDYLQQARESDETTCEPRLERDAFIDGFQSGVIAFTLRECLRLPPLTA